MGVLKTAGLAAAFVLAVPPAALAHVSVTPKAADAGSYQVLRFGLGHGCDDQATTALRIEIPAGVVSARPQPKPGWSLQIERGPGGGEAVASVTWRGGLPADQFDEFLIQVHFPDQVGPLAFPAVQTCGAAEVRWSEPVPPSGARPKRPAPTVLLTPAGGEAPPAAPGPHHQH
ncbi:YcnI family protein [Phenylobacterium sp. LjRoot219]|uniref:YcnI family copper-binding membrane protein n=1 Tax=Phenylobacterium sp. LjRoot219 TaxID=3342283 RepID=UPI003ECEDB4B